MTAAAACDGQTRPVGRFPHRPIVVPHTPSRGLHDPHGQSGACSVVTMQQLLVRIAEVHVARHLSYLADWNKERLTDMAFSGNNYAYTRWSIAKNRHKPAPAAVWGPPIVAKELII